MKKHRHKLQDGHPQQKHPSWSRKKESFYLWMFIAQEGLIEEARDFILEYMDDEVPHFKGPKSSHGRVPVRHMVL